MFPYAPPDDTNLMVASNNAQSPLTAGIDDNDVVIPVSNGALFTAPTLVVIDSEIIYISSVSTNDLNVGERGFGGTTAVSHTDTTPVYGYVLSHYHNQLAAEMKSLSSFTFTDAMRGLNRLENMLAYSEDFGNVAWNKLTGTTVASSNNVAPNGLSTARSLLEGTGAGRQGASASFTAVANGTAIVMSVYAKKDDLDWVLIGQNVNGETGRRAWFNINTGVIGTVGASAKAAIVNVGNGWYRCLLETTQTTNVTKTFDVLMTDADGNVSYTGASTSQTLFWGAQVRQGTLSEVQPYVVTTGVAVSAQQGGVILDEGDLS